jgi:hypothetical protein
MSAPAAEFVADTPTVAGPAPIDPDSPPAAEERPRSFQWGTRKDGTPRAKPGRPAKGRPTGSRARRASKPAAQAAAPKPAAQKPAQSRKRVDYTDAVGSLLGFVMMPVALLFPLDAFALSMQLPDFIKVGNELGNEVPKIGAWLDLFEKYAPYAAATAVLSRAAFQIAHNHGLMPEQAVKMAGGIPREQLALMYAEQKRQQAEAAAEERARFEAAMAQAAQAGAA